MVVDLYRRAFLSDERHLDFERRSTMRIVRIRTHVAQLMHSMGAHDETSVDNLTVVAHRLSLPWMRDSASEALDEWVLSMQESVDDKTPLAEFAACIVLLSLRTALPFPTG